MIKVAIAGATGYTAGELLRILLRHPQVQITSLLSSSSAGQRVDAIHRDLFGETDLYFSAELEPADVIFLCLGHGLSRQFLTRQQLNHGCKIIDLGNDFRVDTEFAELEFIYGLPEIYRAQIKTATALANPGCFATAILLAAYPLSQQFELQDDLHIHGLTGATGAGKMPSDSTHFSYRSANISVYKPFSHQHLAEIKKVLNFTTDQAAQINFVPLRGDFSRGIFVSLTTKMPPGVSIEQLGRYYQAFYASSDFVFVSEQGISLKEVVNTNKALLHLASYQGYVHITAVIDNLLKGASGQAVQNMNLMFGLAENSGLSLKASMF